MIVFSSIIQCLLIEDYKSFTNRSKNGLQGVKYNKYINCKWPGMIFVSILRVGTKFFAINS